MEFFQALEKKTAQRLTHFRLLCLLLLGISTAGCGLRVAPPGPPGPLHHWYEVISDPEAEAFLKLCLEHSRAEFGEPDIPVNQVQLRRSKRIPEARRYKMDEGFSLTQCIDPGNGVFVIYVGPEPGQRKFYLPLGHEAGHLVDAHITDWYMEGIATVFAEEVCEAAGQPWSKTIRRHYNSYRSGPYALSYRMMREMKQAFPVEYPSLVRCTLPGKQKPWKKIDINTWLGRLPEDRREEALGIIRPYAGILNNLTSVQYSFTVPEGL